MIKLSLLFCTDAVATQSEAENLWASTLDREIESR
jgi:hypothetical protein